MKDEEARIKKRFAELAARAEAQCRFVFTDFLGLAEQSLLRESVKESKALTLFGGLSSSERVMARFGDCEELGYEEPFPIVCLRAEPTAPKYADALTHRDILGALMNLGIERETLGDIYLADGTVYFFAEEKIVPFLMESFTRAKHTELRLSPIDTPPDGLLVKKETVTVQVSSERLDAVIARVFSLSREEAQALFAKGLVYLSGRCTESPARAPKAGETVSVRGYGRFLYGGVTSFSKKGKLNVSVEKYI